MGDRGQESGKLLIFHGDVEQASSEKSAHCTSIPHLWSIDEAVTFLYC